MKAHERELLSKKSDQLAEALRLLPTRCATNFDAIFERAFEIPVSGHLVLDGR